MRILARLLKKIKLYRLWGFELKEGARMFKGSMVALVTPMDEQGSIDKRRLCPLVEWHIEQGTQALVIAGSTGESALLTVEEKKQLTKWVVEHTAGRIPVIVGTSAIATKDTVALTKIAMELGADACLIMTPPYVKPTQEGLYQHYKTIADSVAIPIILYNVPGRTSCDMSIDTVDRLANIPNIVGIKESSTVERALALVNRCATRLDVYSGEDPQAAEVILGGGKGLISVAANVVPKRIRDLCDAALAGDTLLATQLQKMLALLNKQLFIESNPIPVKWILAKMGKIQEGIRLPLTPLAKACEEAVQEAMQGME